MGTFLFADFRKEKVLVVFAKLESLHAALFSFSQEIPDREGRITNTANSGRIAFYDSMPLGCNMKFVKYCRICSRDGKYDVGCAGRK